MPPRLARAPSPLLDPLQPLVRFGLLRLLLDPARRQAQPFNGDDLGDPFREKPGIAERDRAAQRMADQYHRLPAQLLDQLRQIVDIVRCHIGTLGRPGAVAMATQVRCDDMIILRQRPRRPVPAAGVVEPAMHQDQRRGCTVAPIQIVEAHAQRRVEMGSRRGLPVHAILRKRVRGRDDVHVSLANFPTHARG